MVKFKVLLERGEAGWWVVTVPALPGCVSQGKTKQEALANITEAIGLHIETLAERGVMEHQRPGVEVAEVSVEV